MAMDKNSLRRRLGRRRRELGPLEVARCSQALCQRLSGLPEVVAAPVLALYIAVAGEIDLRDVLTECKQQQKGVLLPRFDAAAGLYEMVHVTDVDTETAPGHFGIPEPRNSLPRAGRAQLASPELVWVVPGLAFDHAGNRLGRGKGFYDRVLSSAAGCRIGVCYDWQIYSRIPVNGHDVAMDVVVSDRRLLRVASRCAIGQMQTSAC